VVDVDVDVCVVVVVDPLDSIFENGDRARLDLKILWVVVRTWLVVAVAVVAALQFPIVRPATCPVDYHLAVVDKVVEKKHETGGCWQYPYPQQYHWCCLD
jgi:hypothetical protein